nr:phosphatidylinositol N-acetylglucosaminyltransferase subunit Q-like [Lytechinus pictus]
MHLGPERSMEGTAVLKIFFPESLLNARSGLCLGTTHPDNRCMCVLAIVHPSEGDHAPELEINLPVIGMFENVSRDPRPDADEKSRHIGCIVEMTQKHHNEIPACRIVRSPWQHVGDPGNIRILFVLFNDYHILNAQYVCLDDSKQGADSAKNDSHGSTPSMLKEHKKPLTHHCEAVDFLFSAVRHFSKTALPLLASPRNIPMSCLHRDSSSKGFRICSQICEICFILPVLFMRSLFYCLDSFKRTRLIQSDRLYGFLTFPSTGSHLANKLNQFCEFMRKDGKGREEGLSEEVRRSSNDFIRVGNSFSTLMVDLVLGVLMLVWMYNADLPSFLAAVVQDWADQTGIGLQHLLHWLMGAPAGLKLNTFLAHFLGNFFLYHVYLWIGYLSVLLPIMTSLLWCIAGAGILGLSVQLALFSDLLSVLTFHIYCFYVYAARIYSLQMSGLLSLARLFQGKKWNVLRQRVDSCSYDVDQLFMGTLLFTILFFMLPTTALFYVVFTLLRLVILCIQSLLTLLRELLHTFPWFSLFLWLGGSTMLNKEVHFQVLPVSPWQPASLSLQIQLMSLQEALQVGQTPVVTLKPEKMSLLLIFRKLVRGQLIYPWGGDHS